MQGVWTIHFLSGASSAKLNKLTLNLFVLSIMSVTPFLTLFLFLSVAHHWMSSVWTGQVQWSGDVMESQGEDKRILTVTWLILPVVICLSQRLSHACLSISIYTAKLRMAH
jgi:hypothetical protein